MRIAVVDKFKCNPEKCGLECIKSCPKNKMGIKTITIGKKARIDEKTCVGCGICVHKCPFGAIRIINLPEELDNPVHQYGVNGFRVFKFPIIKRNRHIGLLGVNGIGKTTILNIVSGNVIPNLGKTKSVKKEVLTYFKGTENQEYFKELYNKKIKVIYKPQYVDSIPNYFNGKVKDLLLNVSKKIDYVVDLFDLKNILERDIKDISGGELQRLAIATSFLKEGDLYIFDEPSSYLDIKQRLKIAKLISSIKKGVIVVEHDLIVLDYITDIIHILYGEKGAYGIVSNPYSTRNGINSFLQGFLKEENMRIRDYNILFKKDKVSSHILPNYFKWEKLKVKLGGFSLLVNEGNIKEGEIIGIVGQNGIGKTTMFRLFTGEIKPNLGKINNKIKISYKPQYIKPEKNILVKDLLMNYTNIHSQEFQVDIAIPLEIKQLYDRNLKDLSGGELQRVAIALCLSKEADLYLLDEPSAYLDVEQRVKLSKVIKRFIKNRKKAAMIIDHDLMFIDYISDRLLVFDGIPSKNGEALGVFSLEEGMNRFLSSLNITFRRDDETGRPRPNKEDSVMDRKQKEKNQFYYVLSE